MSRSKVLTEAGWKGAVRNAKVRDKDLRRALADFQALDEDAHEERLALIARITSAARALEREVADDPELSGHLKKLVQAAQEEKRELEKRRALATRAAVKAADEDDAEADESEDDEDAGAGAWSVATYPAQLLKMVERLKGAKKPFRIVVCEASPLCAVMIQPGRIGAKHLEVLSAVAGGSRRFVKPPGLVRRGERTLIVEIPVPLPGLALKVARSIRHYTKKKFVVRLGDEVADEGSDDAAAAAADAGAGEARSPARGALAKTPEVWTATRRAVRSRVEELKVEVRKAFAGEGRETLKGLDQSLSTLDTVFERLDDDLAAILARAAASEGPAREAELARAKTLLADHLRFVKSSPMLAHIDTNPFGVATDLQGTLARSLKHVVAALGDAR